jgi:hypothetical protein
MPMQAIWHEGVVSMKENVGLGLVLCVVLGVSVSRGQSDMVWIPPGTFTMGSLMDELTDELGRSSNETQHQMTLTTGYFASKHEVTGRVTGRDGMQRVSPSGCKPPSGRPDLVRRVETLQPAVRERRTNSRVHGRARTVSHGLPESRRHRPAGPGPARLRGSPRYFLACCHPAR